MRFYCFEKCRLFLIRKMNVFEKQIQKLGFKQKVDVKTGSLRYYAKFGARSTKRELRSCSGSLTGDKTSWPCASARLVQNDPPVGRQRQQQSTTNNNKQQPGVHQQPPVDIAPMVIR